MDGQAAEARDGEDSGGGPTRRLTDASLTAHIQLSI